MKLDTMIIQTSKPWTWMMEDWFQGYRNTTWEYITELVWTATFQPQSNSTSGLMGGYQSGGGTHNGNADSFQRLLNSQPEICNFLTLSVMSLGVWAGGSWFCGEEHWKLMLHWGVNTWFSVWREDSDSWADAVLHRCCNLWNWYSVDSLLREFCTLQMLNPLNTVLGGCFTQ
jgi:hypothetical protein